MEAEVPAPSLCGSFYLISVTLNIEFMPCFSLFFTRFYAPQQAALTLP